MIKYSKKSNLLQRLCLRTTSARDKRNSGLRYDTASKTTRGRGSTPTTPQSQVELGSRPEAESERTVH